MQPTLPAVPSGAVDVGRPGGGRGRGWAPGEVGAEPRRVREELWGGIALGLPQARPP